MMRHAGFREAVHAAIRAVDDVPIFPVAANKVPVLRRPDFPFAGRVVA
jgi:hypothetical protein